VRWRAGRGPPDDAAAPRGRFELQVQRYVQELIESGGLHVHDEQAAGAADRAGPEPDAAMDAERDEAQAHGPAGVCEARLGEAWSAADRLFHCFFQDCEAKFKDMPHLAEHTRIHTGGGRGGPARPGAPPLMGARAPARREAVQVQRRDLRQGVPAQGHADGARALAHGRAAVRVHDARLQQKYRSAARRLRVLTAAGRQRS
jgi:hypothetical protein